MRSHSKHLHFIPATLLLSLASPLLAVAPQREFAIAFGGTLGAIAQAQTTQIRKAEAERLIQEANSQFSQAESDEFSQEANSQLIERQYQKALDSFQQALSIYQELAVSEASPIAKRHEVQAVRRRQRDILFMIGVIYGKLGQYEQVLKYSQQVLALDQELGDRCQEQETLFRISSVYGVLGQYDQVLEGLKKTLTLNRELDEPCGKPYFFLLFKVSDVYQRLGRSDQALKTLEQVLAIYRKPSVSEVPPQEEREREKRTLFLMSQLHQQQGQYEQALAFAQQALTIERESGNRRREQSTLIRIGKIYEQQGQYEQALASYQQALTINREFSNLFGEITIDEINTLMSLKRLYRRLGQYEQMLKIYQQALDVGRSEISCYSQEQYVLMSLSQIYRELDRDDRALECYQQALVVGEKLGNIDPSIRALNDWGAVQAKSGQFPEALETFEQALARRRDVDKSRFEENEAIIFRNRGFVYRKLGQLEKAQESYKQALKFYHQELVRARKDSCSREDELRLLREIAQIYKIIGDHYLAQEFDRQSKKAEFVADLQLTSVCTSLCTVPLGIVLTEEGSSSSLVSCK
jgi:tetratricopeptide (TPR) repeat protein